MKKFLALMIVVVMTFSMVAVPVSAACVEAEDIEKIETTVEDAFTFAEKLANAIHKLVGDILAVFDKECPFCDEIHGKTPVEDTPVTPEEPTPDEPVNPDEPTPDEPVEPEEIVGTVANAEELAAALLAGGTYTVLNDFATDAFVAQEGIKVNFDLASYAISGATVKNDGELTIKGGSLEASATGINNKGNAVFTDVDLKAGDAGNYAAISSEGSYTEYNNVNIVSAGGGIGVSNGSKAVFNSGSVDVNSKSTSGRYVFYVVGEGSEVTINDGTFSFDNNLTLKRAYIYAGSGATVIVNGGTFGKASTRSGYTAGIMGDGTVIIKGGTFGFDPSAWVAEGYEAVKDGSVWTVAAVA